MKINQTILLVLVLITGKAAWAQESSIFFARHAELIVVGEVISVSKDTFNQSYIAGHDSGLPQSVVFRVEEVLKGQYKENFLRTMVLFPVKYLQYEKPEQYELKIGKRYIFISQTRTASKDCKQGIERRFEALDCYRTRKEFLIPPTAGEIESIKWMVRRQEPSGDSAGATKTP